MLGGEETDVQFNCSINYGTPLDVLTIWSHENPDGSGRIKQISNSDFVTDVENFAIKGEYNLVIKNVETTDAIYYVCENSLAGDGNIRIFVHLIVLGKLITSFN